MATYLIGDIQGCYEPLQRLLHKIKFDPSGDRLWSCGDVVNRGGQSLEVLRLLKSLEPNVVITLGNHDLYLLAEHVRHPDGNSPNSEFRNVLQAHDRSTLLDWLQHQPLALWSEDFRLLLVHAGLVPQWTITQARELAREVEAVLTSQQSGEFLVGLNKGTPKRWKDSRTGMQRWHLICAILTRLRFCDAGGEALWSASGPPGSQPTAYAPWFKHEHRASRDARIAFGHWAALGVHVKKRYISLDSGCVWGGRLSAFRLDDEQLFQVPGIYR